MQQGNIGITSENIFPIIKKFLYSDSDIFIREIISNAVDAIKKLQVVSQNPFTPLIQVHIDTNLNTITVKDNGIGMDADEIEKYINQIAFSGASDFLAKYKDAQIIGHFGLGFYSSFMVSDKVEIITKSYKENAVPQHWTCEGTPSFSLEDTEKETVGTDIVMHINEQYKEYLDSKKIIELLNTYNKFTGIKIEVSIDDKDAEEIEAIEPLWTKKPSELTDDDYLEFYRKLYPEKSDPLYWLHLNVDFPFNLSGILYFPSIKEISVIDKSNICLYCNQVYVTDNVNNILPQFLALLRGVIDSPDIPLNVSRSYLQSDMNVKKISKYITNKVVNALKDKFASNREEYDKNWNDVEPFLQVGLITEEELYDKLKDIFLLKDYNKKLYTIEEYTELTKGNQTDKDGNLVWLFTFDPVKQYSYITQAEANGYSVLLLDNQFSTYLINLFEHKIEKLKIYRVDSNTIDKLINKGDEDAEKLDNNDVRLLIDIFSSQLKSNDNVNFNIRISTSSNSNALPITIIADEQSRRMRELSMTNPMFSFYRDFKQQMSIVFDANSDVIKKLLKDAKKNIGKEYQEMQDKVKSYKDNLDLLEQSNKNKKPEEITDIDKDAEKQYKDGIGKINAEISNLVLSYSNNVPAVKQMLDVAYLQNGMLEKDDLVDFIKRTIEFIKI